MIEANLYFYIVNQSTITAIVGSGGVYPHHLTQFATFPAITIQTISVNHDHVIQGAAGVKRCRIQIDCWSHSLDQVLDCAEKIRLKLMGYMGMMGSSDVRFVELDSTRNMHEAPTDGSDQWLYRVSSDYIFTVGESVPSITPAP